MIRVPPAHPQKRDDNPDSICGTNAPTNPKIIIDRSTNPIISSIFVMFFYLLL